MSRVYCGAMDPRCRSAIAPCLYATLTIWIYKYFRIDGRRDDDALSDRQLVAAGWHARADTHDAARMARWVTPLAASAIAYGASGDACRASSLWLGSACLGGRPSVQAVQSERPTLLTCGDLRLGKPVRAPMVVVRTGAFTLGPTSRCADSRVATPRLRSHRGWSEGAASTTPTITAGLVVVGNCGEGWWAAFFTS
jgi:hypothetical protein